jgi:hypothetical protein
MKAIELQSGDRRLEGHLAEPELLPPRAAGLVFIHGLRSSHAGYIPRVEAVSTALKVVCLAFDLGGHGHSEGVLQELTTRDHLADVCVAFDYLAGLQEVDTERIGICGASYGGYLTALLTSERPVRRLLLRAPAVYADENVDVPIGQWPQGKAGRPSTAAFERLRAFSGQVLVVESEHDTVIPPSVIDRYVGSSAFTRRVVIPGAGHALEPEFEQPFLDIVCGWFGDL